MNNDSRALSDIVGPWEEMNVDSGLIERCRNAWNKPIVGLSNQDLATYLRQKIAVEQLILIAKKRVEDQVDDGTEIYDGELAAAIADAEGKG